MKNLLLRLFFFSVLLLPVLAAPAAAERPSFDTSARNAIVIDFQTGAVLLDKNADQRIPTASMSKIMTAYTVYTYLRDGKAKLGDLLPVSERAWRTGLSDNESRMFVPLNGRVKIEDLLRGMIVQSGNDACVVLAEGLAGSQEAFVAKMNELAQKMGLTNSHFANVHGLPAPDHYSSPRDLATLSRHLIQDFPQYYRYESEKEFTFNGIKQGNRNPLLYKDLGADGIKTGHTEEAGYGLVGSAVRNGRRVIFVLSGMQSMKERGQEGERVLDWAFREFSDYTIAKAGEPIDEAPVWMGVAEKVPVAPQSDAVMTLWPAARKELKVSAVYDGTVKAPVAKGQVIGKLVIAAPDNPPLEVPLVATQAVGRLGPLGRMAEAAGYLLWGKKR
ncbi:MAG TPA: D-alanyl-D-alanine carboxypeptidase family protein [Stellaceae bacterium]|nr:D-alanyl-D-alanine carboxypeptidase family protein [Stellaceae bacterium]